MNNAGGVTEVYSNNKFFHDATLVPIERKCDQKSQTQDGAKEQAKDEKSKTKECYF